MHTKTKKKGSQKWPTRNLRSSPRAKPSSPSWRDARSTVVLVAGIKKNRVGRMVPFDVYAMRSLPERNGNASTI